MTARQSIVHGLREARQGITAWYAVERSAADNESLCTPGSTSGTTTLTISAR